MSDEVITITQGMLDDMMPLARRMVREYRDAVKLAQEQGHSDDDILMTILEDFLTAGQEGLTPGMRMLGDAMAFAAAVQELARCSS